jgi:hypothetical protein
MNALQRLALLVTAVFAGHAMAAESGPPATFRSVVASRDNFVIAQVEYCLRNAPELSAELSLAHATYAQASALAVQILDRQYPKTETLARVVVADDIDSRSKAMLLRDIQSHGPGQCPAVVSYLHNATGETLAKTLGADFESLRRASRDRQ